MGVVGVTVTFNSAEAVRQLLGSVEGQLDEVIVVDNGSQDDVESVAREFPFVRLIKSTTNLGFARAVNKALADSDSHDVLLLNPDVQCPPGSVAQLVAESAGLGDQFILAPLLRYPDGRIQESARTYPTMARLLARRTLFGRTPLGSKILRDHLALPDHVAPAEWVIGAVMFVPRPVLNVIGAMDERFYLYCEDVDWCVRAWRSGSGVMYVPSVEMQHGYHRGSRQTWHLTDRTTRLHWKSMARLYAKYPSLVLTGPVHTSVAKLVGERIGA